MQTANLLRRCASALADGRLSADESALLRNWSQGIEQRTATVAARFHSAPTRRSSPPDCTKNCPGVAVVRLTWRLRRAPWFGGQGSRRSTSRTSEIFRSWRW